jgi:hypothetical protein
MPAFHPVLHLAEALNDPVQDRHCQAGILDQERVEVDRLDHERLDRLDRYDGRRSGCGALLDDARSPKKSAPVPLDR